MTYAAYGIPAVHLVLCARDHREYPPQLKAEEWETTPLCFSLQPLSMPGVIYIISLVRTPNTENLLMSVHRPGIALDNRRTKLNAIDSAGEA